MDTSYGIGIANRYALFMGDEDEPGSQPILAPAKGKENKATTAPKKVPAASNAPKTTSGSTKPTAPAPGNKATPSSGPNNKSGAPGQGPRNDRPRNQGNQNDSRGPRTENHKSGEGNARGPRPDRPPREPRDNNNQGAERPKRDRIVRPSGGAPGEGKGQGGEWPSGGSFGGQRDGENNVARKNNRNRDDRGQFQTSNPSGLDENRPFRPRQDRGTREGRGGGRGGRRFENRGDNRDNRGKPLFERHSGSDKAGVKPVEKKEGAGAFNWGTPEDELAGQNDKTDETAIGDRSGDETAPEQTEQTNGVEETKPEEEEVKEYTLDEWKRMQNQEKKKSHPTFNIRKPNEGEDNAQWKKTYLLTKKKEEEEPAEEYEEITYEVETETTKRKKQVLDIDIKFRSEKFDGRDRRGGRGGGRGGRDDRGPRKPREAGDDSHGGEGARGPPRGGRGGPRGPRGGRDQAPPKVDDINDFPTLVTA